MMSSILEWLTSSSSWSGTGGIGARTWQHLFYSGIVLAITCAIAIPLGLYIGHAGRAGWAVTLANVGVTPDEIVEVDNKTYLELYKEAVAVKDDAQLQAAIKAVTD